MTKATGSGFVPGGVAALTGVGFVTAAALLVNGRHVPPLGMAAIIGAVACFALAAVQGRRAKPKPHGVAHRVSRGQLRTELHVFIAGVIAFAPFAGYGGYLLYERNTGPHVGVTVTRCEGVGTAVTHTGPHDYCYGDWTYDGRMYVDKYVQGADLEDEGKVIDCTVHGDTAYSRDLQTPLIALIVFGGAASIAASQAIATSRRLRRMPG